MRSIQTHLLPLTLILLVSFFGFKALLHPGLFTAHDIWHQVARFYYYSHSISDGQFPPMWISNMANGYGYPLFIFSYHFPWLVGIPFLKAGLDLFTTLKLLFILSYICSGVFMYFFVYELFKSRLSGLISAILYLFAPYHFLETYVSAQIGTDFVFALLPLFFWGLLRICKTSGTYLTSISLAAIILSHTLSLFTLGFVFVFFLIWIIKKDGFVNINKLAISLILGLLISSFYLGPAIAYNHLTLSQTDFGFTHLYQRNFLNFSQIIYSKWGFGPIIKNAKDGELSFQLGIAQWLVLIGVVIALVLKQLKEFSLLAICLLLALFFSISSMLNYSRPVWDFITKFLTFDYPFRFLLPAVFITSVLGGLLVVTVRKFRLALVVCLSLIAFYTNRNYTKVNLYTNYALSDYISAETTTNTFNEYLPSSAKSTIFGTEALTDPKLPTSQYFQNSKELSFKVANPESGTYSIHQFAFPGQSLTVDNQSKNYSFDRFGRIMFIIPQGNHKILVQYKNTPLVTFFQWLSLLSIISLLLFPKWQKKLSL